LTARICTEVRPGVRLGVALAPDDVAGGDAVPAKYLVGEENRGWYIGMTTLDFERSNISSAAQYRRTLDELVGYVKGNGKSAMGNAGGARLPIADRLSTSLKLADLAIENEVGRYLSYRVASMQERGQGV
jgi:alkylation response protein AidB-like acyl-CoA dehydrogenase